MVVNQSVEPGFLEAEISQKAPKPEVRTTTIINPTNNQLFLENGCFEAVTVMGRVTGISSLTRSEGEGGVTKRGGTGMTKEGSSTGFLSKLFTTFSNRLP